MSLQTVSIEASCGIVFEADRATGLIVTPPDRVRSEYRDYVAVELSEYSRWCEENQLMVGPVVPILATGLRRRDGRVDSPVEAMRELMLHPIQQDAVPEEWGYAE